MTTILQVTKIVDEVMDRPPITNLRYSLELIPFAAGSIDGSPHPKIPTCPAIYLLSAFLVDDMRSSTSNFTPSTRIHTHTHPPNPDHHANRSLQIL